MTVDTRLMFRGAKPEIFALAKKLRSNMTDSEKVLWNLLRNNLFQGLHFRRQHPIENFILDFYCHQLKLAIEVDGGIHIKSEIKEYDDHREKILKEWGIRVIRISNEEISNNPNDVLQSIKTEIEKLNL